MVNLKTWPCYVCKALILILFAYLLNEVTSVHAQNQRAVYDGRIEIRISEPSNADVQLMRRHALPRSHQFWTKNDICAEGVEVIDVASGSFTSPHAEQRAVLYWLCVTGNNLANNSIAIIEGGGIVAHSTYDGGEDYSIGALTDTNDNGLSEIVLGDGSTNQGYTTSVDVLIDFTSSGVSKFLVADVYEDNCGTLERCKMLAYKVAVNPGLTPIFYRETYRKKNGR